MHNGVQLLYNFVFGEKTVKRNHMGDNVRKMKKCTQTDKIQFPHFFSFHCGVLSDQQHTIQFVFYEFWINERAVWLNFTEWKWIPNPFRVCVFPLSIVFSCVYSFLTLTTLFFCAFTMGIELSEQGKKKTIRARVMWMWINILKSDQRPAIKRITHAHTHVWMFVRKISQYEVTISTLLCVEWREPRRTRLYHFTKDTQILRFVQSLTHACGFVLFKTKCFFSLFQSSFNLCTQLNT